MLRKLLRKNRKLHPLVLLMDQWDITLHTTQVGTHTITVLDGTPPTIETTGNTQPTGTIEEIHGKVPRLRRENTSLSQTGDNILIPLTTSGTMPDTQLMEIIKPPLIPMTGITTHSLTPITLTHTDREAHTQVSLSTES